MLLQVTSRRLERGVVKALVGCRGHRRPWKQVQQKRAKRMPIGYPSGIAVRPTTPWTVIRAPRQPEDIQRWQQHCKSTIAKTHRRNVARWNVRNDQYRRGEVRGVASRT